MKKTAIFLLSSIIFLGACSQSNEKTVNVYSSRHYEVDKQIFKNFEEKTGIKVNLISADAQALLARMEEEKTILKQIFS